MTVIMYLQAAEEGGETHFPLVGLKLKPLAGDGIVFFNVQADGTRELLSQHAGHPVLRGRKVVATKWIHGRTFPLSLHSLTTYKSNGS